MSNNANTGTIQIASAAGAVFTPVLSNDFIVFSSQSNTSMYLGASNAPNFLQISSNFAYTSNLNTSNLTVGGVLTAKGAINATGQTVTAASFAGNAYSATTALYATSAGTACNILGTPATVTVGTLTSTTHSNSGTFSNGGAFSNFGTFCNVGNAFFGSNLTVVGTTVVQNITVSNVETLVQSFSNQGTLSNAGAAFFGGAITATGQTVTAGSFVGSLTGTATGLSGTPNITVGNVNATYVKSTGYLDISDMRAYNNYVNDGGYLSNQLWGGSNYANGSRVNACNLTFRSATAPDGVPHYITVASSGMNGGSPAYLSMGMSAYDWQSVVPTIKTTANYGLMFKISPDTYSSNDTNTVYFHTNGNVGIGLGTSGGKNLPVAPVAKLDVNGTARATSFQSLSGYTSQSSGVVTIFTMTAATSGILTFSDGGSVTGCILLVAANVSGGTGKLGCSNWLVPRIYGDFDVYIDTSYNVKAYIAEGAYNWVFTRLM